MSIRILLIVALLLGVAVGIAADALGYSRILVQVPAGISFAILVAGPLWWSAHRKSSGEKHN
jgi:hypothetical protein